MTDKKSSENRRKLLKTIAAGSGAIVAGKSLPESWSRPVVDSVMLPAHAMTSLLTIHAGQDVQNSAQLDTDSMFAEAINSLVPEAKAAGDTVTYDYCVEPNLVRTAADIVIVATWFNAEIGCRHNARYYLNDVPVDSEWHPMFADWDSCRLGDNSPRVKLTSLAGNAVGTFMCSCADSSDFDLPEAACNLPSAPVCESGCATNCLAHDTRILTPGNHYRAIDSLQTGDMVTGLDQDGISIYTVVTKVVTRHMRDDFYTINGDLRITDDHPVLVSRDETLVWCRVDNLTVGDQICTLDDYIEIVSLEYHDQPLETVYVETQCGNFIAMAGSGHYVVKSNYAEAAERLQRGEVKAFA